MKYSDKPHITESDLLGLVLGIAFGHQAGIPMLTTNPMQITGCGQVQGLIQREPLIQLTIAGVLEFAVATGHEFHGIIPVDSESSRFAPEV
jgi:hypothetical protein